MPGKAFLWEVIRKLVHLSGIVIVVGYTLLMIYFSERVAILTITALLLVLLEIEYVRLEHRPKIVEYFKSMFRPHEEDNISGAVFMVISCIICFAAFDYWVAFLALFMTVFGDLFAAIVGKGFGTTKLFKSKSVVGTLSGFTANTLVGFFVLPGFFLLFLPMAFTATIAELFTNKLDDNLTVPLFAGFMGQMIVYAFGLTLPVVNFL